MEKAGGYCPVFKGEHAFFGAGSSGGNVEYRLQRADAADYPVYGGSPDRTGGHGRLGKRRPFSGSGGGSRGGQRCGSGDFYLRQQHLPGKGIRGISEKYAGSAVPPYSETALYLARGPQDGGHHSAVYQRRGNHPEFRLQSADGCDPHCLSDGIVSDHHVPDERRAVLCGAAVHAGDHRLFRVFLFQDFQKISGRGRGGTGAHGIAPGA